MVEEVVVLDRDDGVLHVHRDLVQGQQLPPLGEELGDDLAPPVVDLAAQGRGVLLSELMVPAGRPAACAGRAPRRGSAEPRRGRRGKNGLDGTGAGTRGP